MTTDLVATATALRLPLPVTWRDPHTVPRDLLRAKIAELETACNQQPDSPDLWTCLGMAYAMDFRVHPSMEVLEKARNLAPDHFWAQFKLSELYYRLRTLTLAEKETLRALELAGNPAEYLITRKQLQEIRRLVRDGTQKPDWTRSLLPPVVALSGLAFAGALIVSLLR